MFTQIKLINHKWKLFFAMETTSTQDVARSHILNNEDFHRSIYLADYQTAGRGRNNRTWYSLGQNALSFSICLKPTIPMSNISSITLIAAISLYEALTEETDTQLQIKWPNDLLIGTKKVAGILTECVPINSLDYGVIIGIGLNVNQPDNAFPEEVKNIATSLFIENKKMYDRMDVLQKFIDRFEQNYEIFLEKGFSDFREKYLNYSNLINKKVIHSLNEVRQEATIVDITSTGNLVLEKSDKTFEVFSGEIQVIGK